MQLSELEQPPESGQEEEPEADRVDVDYGSILAIRNTEEGFDSQLAIGGVLGLEAVELDIVGSDTEELNIVGPDTEELDIVVQDIGELDTGALDSAELDNMGWGIVEPNTVKLDSVEPEQETVVALEQEAVELEPETFELVFEHSFSGCKR